MDRKNSLTLHKVAIGSFFKNSIIELSVYYGGLMKLL